MHVPRGVRKRLDSENRHGRIRTPQAHADPRSAGCPVLGAAVMSGAVPRSAVEVFRDSAVRFFLAVVGPVAASVLSVERGNPRVLRVAAPATDGGWSMVYPSATGTSGRVRADHPAGEHLARRETGPVSGGVLIGYARCSTDKQDLTAQRVALRELGVSEDRVYLDHGLTGRNRNRPGLQQALAAVREGDTLVVPKLDSPGRSRTPGRSATPSPLEASDSRSPARSMTPMTRWARCSSTFWRPSLSSRSIC
jgi:Resolvase, N terminal domain